jgi:E2/UBC family protein A/ThiF family protein/JAB domain-containing protein similar to deubiquitination enzymes
MLSEESYYNWGISITQDESICPELQGFLTAVKRNPFVHLIDIQKNDLGEAVIIEIRTELPQRPPVPIQRVERVAIVISQINDIPPTVLALRKNFPETLHQNLVKRGSPKSFCLFEEAYSEVRLRLTPEMFLQRIANWLARAAVEELHQDNQPIEPLLLTRNRIIFDPKIFDLQKEDKQEIVVFSYSEDPLLLRAVSVDNIPNDLKKKSFVLFPIDAPPWHLRVIEYSPENFEELAALLNRLQVDLESLVREFVRDLLQSSNSKSYLDKKVIMLLRLPKTRAQDGPVEGLPEFWSFWVSATVEELSIQLGIRAKQGKELGILLGPPISSDLDKIKVLPLKPTYALDEQFARLLSGVQESNQEIVTIGAGALGSQAILNLARQGFGKWHIVDPDFMLPHNLSRHALTSAFEGQPKSIALSLEINQLLNSKDVATPYPVDILGLADKSSKLWKAMEKSDLIIDFSTSRAVSKFLVISPFRGRKICIFITASGNHLVALAEGISARAPTLEDLDYQLAATIVDNPDLSNTYSSPKFTSFAGSCRDTSVQLAQDTVGMFAAISAKFIKSLATQDDPLISVWAFDNASLEVRCHQLTVFGVKSSEKNGWTVRISDQANREMQHYRASRLPNETGGVLLGAFDVAHQIIYVSKALPSPEDSVEWPTTYIRGMNGLKEKVEGIKAITGNELSYVGEWHSHPRKYSNSPSELDLVAHSILQQEMNIEGLPGLMLIKSDHRNPYILLNDS